MSKILRYRINSDLIILRQIMWVRANYNYYDKWIKGSIEIDGDLAEEEREWTIKDNDEIIDKALLFISLPCPILYFSSSCRIPKTLTMF